MAETVTVRLNRFQIRVQSIEAGRKLITEVVSEIRRDARIILASGPYTTGRLVTGIESEIRYTATLITARVGIKGRRFPYAASVEKGARSHFIPLTPKGPGTWLVFYWRKVGRVVAFKQVHHPGQAAKAYLRRPLVESALRHRMRFVTYDL